MGCAVFCRRASGGGFYAPRVELNDAGKDPYFPDGTWCHNDGSQDYYCLQHHCLPEVRSSIELFSVGRGNKLRYGKLHHLINRFVVNHRYNDKKYY